MCPGSLCWGRKVNGVFTTCTSFGTVSSSVSSADWIYWRFRVASSGTVSVGSFGGGYNSASGSFTVPITEIRGQGGTFVVDGTSTTVQSWGYNVSP